MSFIPLFSLLIYADEIQTLLLSVRGLGWVMMDLFVDNMVGWVG